MVFFLLTMCFTTLRAVKLQVIHKKDLDNARTPQSLDNEGTQIVTAFNFADLLGTKTYSTSF